MKRVVNCVLRNGDRILLLQKPSRGWWVAPGGKVEPLETIEEAVKREFVEETGVRILNPQLRGVFTIVIREEDEPIEEWMLFTFYADQFEGTPLRESPEGKLSWHAVSEIGRLPKAEGDNVFLRHVLHDRGVLIGRFVYTPDYRLLEGTAH
ncbi:8-oxo-dGTP diphosphatase [Bacillaceae bacterium]